MNKRFYTEAERRRILAEAVGNASKVPILPEAEARKAARDPRAVHACPRFHGRDSERYARLAEIMRHIPHAHQGRGRCSECGHQVFYDPGHPDQFPERKLCLHCMLSAEGMDPSEMGLEPCGSDPCPYGALNDKEGTHA